MSGKPQVVSMLALAVLALGCSEAGQQAVVGDPAQSVVPPVAGNGTGTITSLEILSSRQAGGNVVQERRLTGTMTGALEGSVVEEVQGVIHGNGHVTFQGTVAFDGTVAGCGSGSLQGSLSGKGIAGQPVTDATFRITNQPANTLRVNGTGTIHQVGTAFTYEFHYVCH